MRIMNIIEIFILIIVFNDLFLTLSIILKFEVNGKINAIFTLWNSNCYNKISVKSCSCKIYKIWSNGIRFEWDEIKIYPKKMIEILFL